MALSDKRIVEEMAKGDIVIDPFDSRNLSTSSYDVTLGEWFYRPRILGGLNETPLFNIYSEYQMREIWHHPQRAQTVEELGIGHGDGINPGDRAIILNPGETILAHTNEFIGGRGHITTMMKARSSMGRSFIGVCKCAGWGDVGFINRWTMEITNYSDRYRIPLIVGRRIGQLVFFETGEAAGDYGKSGNYQQGVDLDKLKAEWKPEMMLPKLYKDRDIQK